MWTEVDRTPESHVSERQSFIEQIKTSPADDVARLVFADWLEEHAETDLDVATCEFIRLDCQAALAGKSGRLHPRAGKWLRQNAERLTPGLAEMTDGFTAHWAGRYLTLQASRRAMQQHEWIARSGMDTRYPFTLHLAFRRGFVESMTFPSAFGVYRQVGPELLRDQPLAILRTGILGIEMHEEDWESYYAGQPTVTVAHPTERPLVAHRYRFAQHSFSHTVYDRLVEQVRSGGHPGGFMHVPNSPYPLLKFRSKCHGETTTLARDAIARVATECIEEIPTDFDEQRALEAFGSVGRALNQIANDTMEVLAGALSLPPELIGEIDE